jgi:hypothetical protein
MKNHWVMDYETLINCWLGVFEHYKTDEVKVFTIGKLKNDLPAFLAFLTQNQKNDEWHISFNGLSFDAQITQYILTNARNLLTMTGERAGNMIYIKAQECIEKGNRREFPQWSEYKLSVKQIDLFKLNHWDNPAKRSSLKSIQVAMRWHNVQDMPIPHTTPIETIEQLQKVAEYCRNDVASTKAIMQLSQGQINLRGKLTKQYGVRLFSASEPRISKELFLYFLSQKTQRDPYELKKLRTFRKHIDFEKIILPYVNFDGLPLFEHLLKEFKQVMLDPLDTRGGFKTEVTYRGLKSKFGLGGVHGAKKGVYVAQEGMIIMSSDVVSFYPRLAMVNEWAPAQLPKKTFCEQYQWFFDERRKLPKSNPNNYVYKIVLNSTYGLSNDKNSFLYYPEFTMRITVNGQLSLTMLYTMLCERLRGAIPLMQNTDGVEIMIPETEKEKYLKICAEWEQLTGLELEHDQYQKLFIPDVNSYIGVFDFKEVTKDEYEKLKLTKPEDPIKTEEGKFYHAATKRKGRLEFKDLALHKNHSFLIIKKALFYYFVHDIKPEDYLAANRDIFDYCGAVKSRGDWMFKEHYVENEQTVDLNVAPEIKHAAIEAAGLKPAYEKEFWIKSHMDPYKAKGWSTNEVYTAIKRGTVVEKELQKTVRYYVSNKGSKLMKHNRLDGRKNQVDAGKWLQTVFNVHEDKPWEEYGIDDRYYLDKIYKEIKSLVPERFDNQMSLF